MRLTAEEARCSCCSRHPSFGRGVTLSSAELDEEGNFGTTATAQRTVSIDTPQPLEGLLMIATKYVPDRWDEAYGSGGARASAARSNGATQVPWWVDGYRLGHDWHTSTNGRLN